MAIDEKDRVSKWPFGNDVTLNGEAGTRGTVVNQLVVQLPCTSTSGTAAINRSGTGSLIEKRNSHGGSPSRAPGSVGDHEGLDRARNVTGIAMSDWPALMDSVERGRKPDGLAIDRREGLKFEQRQRDDEKTGQNNRTASGEAAKDQTLDIITTRTTTKLEQCPSRAGRF
ncbi:hypothetical protein Plec18167_009478 [Paecilomyces lecythidis]|uniref:Uncharacterized protein n=1 Tax=Paecilomyces lecythidis TaxID=3004212 RepID=A0ABR3WP27_9EURO